MSNSGGVDVIFLKHSETYLYDLLGPLRGNQCFKNDSRGSKSCFYGRHDFEQNYAKNYDLPKDLNYTFNWVGDDIDSEGTFEAIPRFLEELEELEEMIAMVNLYFPQDKELFKTITWKEWILNMEFFIFDWDVEKSYIPKMLKKDIFMDWDNDTQTATMIKHTDLLKEDIKENRYPVFFNTSIVEWIKLIREEISFTHSYDTYGPYVNNEQ